MIPVGFDYARPESLEGAIALLEEHGEDATVLAGGHSLLPVMKLRLGAPELVIDIGRLSELQYIRVDGDEVAIGAGTRHRTVEASELLAAECEGAEVRTIEGMANPDGSLSPIQKAFQDYHGLQCGFCTPGMVMSAAALLKDNPSPSERETRDYLEGNICRCTGYHNIVKAIAAGAKAMSKGA